MSAPEPRTAWVKVGMDTASHLLFRKELCLARVRHYDHMVSIQTGL